MESIG
jgi:signal transduction histidine kinase